jgi:hypothetical protein
MAFSERIFFNNRGPSKRASTYVEREMDYQGRSSLADFSAVYLCKAIRTGNRAVEVNQFYETEQATSTARDVRVWSILLIESSKHVCWILMVNPVQCRGWQMPLVTEIL